MPLATLAGNPSVTLVFMRLPDGGGNCTGFASTGFWRANFNCHAAESRACARREISW